MSRFYDVAPLEGYHPEIGLLLASLADSTREWRENLGRPGRKAIVWQQYTDGPSIGAVILHLIDTEAYWLETYAAGRPSPPGETELLLARETKQDSGRWPVPPSEPIEWYFDLHDRIRARVWEAVRGIEPERRYGSGKFSCTFRWIVAHVLEHDSYHGGQAVLLHQAYRRRGR